MDRQLSMKSLYSACIYFAAVHYILTAFTTERRSFLRGKHSHEYTKDRGHWQPIINYFRKYPGLPIPFNLMIHRHSTSAYAAAYLCAFDVIAGIFVRGYKVGEAFPNAPAWLSVLYMVFAVSLLVSTILPVFISISKGGFVHWSVGCLYCLLHVSYTVASIIRSTCMGTDHFLQKLSLQVPSVTGFLYLFVYFCHAIWSQLRNPRMIKLIGNSTGARTSVVNSVSHVKELLLPKGAYQKLMYKREQKRKTWHTRFLMSAKHLYNPGNGFTYPPALVWCMCVTIVLQYFLLMQLLRAVNAILLNGKKNIQHKYPHIDYSFSINLGIPNAQRVNQIFVDTNDTEVYSKMFFEYIYYWMDIFWVCVVLATTLAMLFNVLLVFRIMLNYQTLSLRIYRHGFKVIGHVQQWLDAFKVTRGTIIYPSYQISLMACGFYFQTLTYLIISLLLAVIVTMNAFTNYKFVVNFFATWWPGMLLLTVFGIAQQIAIRFLFTQNRGKSYGFDNVRSLQLYIFFSSFYNVFFGMVSGVGRILYCPISTALCISRLDISALGHPMQSVDTGYLAFMAFLYADVLMNNPNFRVFLWLLLDRHRKRTGSNDRFDNALTTELKVFSRLTRCDKHNVGVKVRKQSVEHSPSEIESLHMPSNEGYTYDNGQTGLFSVNTRQERNRGRERNKWLLAYTLIRNPELLKFRKSTHTLAYEVQVVPVFAGLETD